MPEQPQNNVAGLNIIKKTLPTLPAKPGVYRMINGKGEVLYVGKAKNLKKRVSAYARVEGMHLRLQRMVMKTHSIEIVTTHTEAEALLLESNLIKRLKPHYNILLRDDKSFPHIMITGDHKFARILKHRGSRRKGHEYFGPFASASAVNRTLTSLQKVFLLRSCSDSVFSSRTRPCLLYQIKRCCAPCVERISKKDYDALVHQARNFLKGHSTRIQDELAKKMEEASRNLNYEMAAQYRDRIHAMTAVQSRQDINLSKMEETDVVALHRAGGQSCIQVFFFRGGKNFGNRAYFPSHDAENSDVEIIEAFIGQFYHSFVPPKQVLVTHKLPNEALLIRALTIKADRRVRINMPRRGERRKIMEHASSNAKEALARRLSESSAQRKLLDGVQSIFGTPTSPQRIEVFDNSHTSGTNMVGAMIVAGAAGFVRSAYRKWNIRSTDITPGDDYGAMREVLNRRFTRIQKEDPHGEKGQWPDLVLLDGGSGQLNAALDVFDELGIHDVTIAAIAKGTRRRAGRESFHIKGRDSFTLQASNPVLYYLQRLRDEAHRFAISAHRTRRAKTITKSLLDNVAGVGAKRKRALLHHFGSAKAVADAGLLDLKGVGGISHGLARRIYDHFHANS